MLVVLMLPFQPRWVSGGSSCLRTQGRCTHGCQKGRQTFQVRSQEVVLDGNSAEPADPGTTEQAVCVCGGEIGGEGGVFEGGHRNQKEKEGVLVTLGMPPLVRFRWWVGRG